MPHTRRPVPTHFWIGLALIAVAWPLNWLLRGVRTHLLFFPLWLGYCLAVDGWVFHRKGSSLLTRSPRAYAGLFLVSAPAWWLFEAINLRTQNWVYEGRELFTFAGYATLATLSFSTVIPAVFGSAELFSTFGWLRRARRGPVIRPTRAVTAGFFVAGWAMLALMLAWPRYFFPFVWLSVYFILAPVNVWLGHRSLGHHTARGDWRPVLALWGGVLLTAFFWEMWNYLAFPKWVYRVPFVDFVHIFEMPILGYGGYLPFSMELFDLYHLAVGLLAPRLVGYVQIGGDEDAGGA
jgi:hypothetical protein